MSESQTFDLVIVGSGGASITAALVARAAGKRPVILEKQGVAGGSTAYSGGVIWAPTNPFLGTRDSFAMAQTYLDGLAGDDSDAARRRRAAFIRHSPMLIEFLQRHGMKFMHAHWPDYYSDAPGGLAEGRSLVCPLFDINELGEWASRLAAFSEWPALPIGSHEFAALSLFKHTWRGRGMAVRVAARLLSQKLTGKRLRGSGGALQGRMLQVALRHKIPIWLNARVEELIVEADRVVAVNVAREGKTVRVEAKHGVLLDAGGFSHNMAMRRTYQLGANNQWSLSNPGDTGEVMLEALKLGAAVDLMDEAWWVPSSFLPSGKLQGFHVPIDTAKPHCIVVDRDGRRIGNEAGAYMEFGQRMFAAGAVPAWAILEHRHRQRYAWGALTPGKTPDALIGQGYIKKSESLHALAFQCGIDPHGLAATIARFNSFCSVGVDSDFHRGASAHNRSVGDPTYTPNACLGPLCQAPYYAVAIQPADVGTAGGLVTDEHGRVMRSDGSVIQGLYAAGNCTASVMGRCYPGAGASIGAAFVFGLISARHAHA